MRTETAIRERLEQRVATTEIGHLADLDAIAVGAASRDRSRRLMGGLGTIVVVAVLLLGVGAALNDSDPSAVFAGHDGHELVPSSVALHDGELVGVAVADPDLEHFAQQRDYVVVRSEDGQDWTAVDDLPLIEGTNVVVAAHEGTFHVLSTRFVSTSNDDDEERTELEVVHQHTSDFEEFTTIAHPAPDELWAEGQIARPFAAVARDAGVALAIRSNPNWTSGFPKAIEEAGIDREDVCDGTGSATTVRYRVCGESEWITVPVDTPSSQNVWQDTVLFAEPGQRFEVVSPPEQEQQRFPGPNLAVLYPTPDGFGVGGNPPNETVDFETWTEVHTGDDPNPMMAIRGSERVFRSFGPVQRFGPDDPVLGMAYSPDDGETWEDIDIGSLYDKLVDVPKFFTNLQAGPAGWVVVAQRQLRGEDLDVEGVERDSRSGASDFVLTADGFELAGHTPFGPATLSDPTGQVIRTWEHLETMRPQMSGFVSQDQSVTLIDEASGVGLVSFSFEQWTAIVPGTGGMASQFDLLFSANGTDWDIMHTSDLSVQILAVTDASVIAQTVDIVPFERQWVPEITVIPVTVGE